MCNYGSTELQYSGHLCHCGSTWKKWAKEDVHFWHYSVQIMSTLTQLWRYVLELCHKDVHFGRLAKSVWSRLKQLEKQTAFKSSVAQQLRDAEKEIIIIIVFTIRVSYIFTLSFLPLEGWLAAFWQALTVLTVVDARCVYVSSFINKLVVFCTNMVIV